MTDRPDPSDRPDSVAAHELNTEHGWDSRYANLQGLGVPGTLLHSEAGNRAFYRVKRRGLDRCLRRIGEQWKGRAVLDAAGGTGQFVDHYVAGGAAHVCVADFSAEALSAVERRFRDDPRVAVRHADMSAEGLSWDREYDLVFVLEAIFLLERDERFDRALGNLAAAVRPGGHLIVSDRFPPARTVTRAYVVRRSMREFEDGLSANGLEVVDLVPQTFFFDRRLFGRFQNAVERHAGTALASLDALATRLLRPRLVGHPDRTKYLIARKP